MTQQAPFNPNEHLMKIGKGDSAKDYLAVQWRLVWFREACPDGTIETEMLHLDLDRVTEEEVSVWNNEKRRSEKVVKQANGFAMFKATVKDGKGGVATGTKSEKAASFPDYIEKAETGAIGRALAALGYGTQFAPELSEEHRIVDSPIERGDANAAEGNTAQAVPASHITLGSLKNDAIKCGFITGKNAEELKASWLDQLNQIFDGKVPSEEALGQGYNLARINSAITAHKRAAGAAK